MALAPSLHDFWECDCESCLQRRDDAVDRYIDSQSDRETQRAEKLDLAGYYDEI